MFVPPANERTKAAAEYARTTGDMCVELAMNKVLTLLDYGDLPRGLMLTKHGALLGQLACMYASLYDSVLSDMLDQ